MGQQITQSSNSNLQQFNCRFNITDHPNYPNTDTLFLLNQRLNNNKHILSIKSHNDIRQRNMLEQLICKKLATTNPNITAIQQYIFEQKSGYCNQQSKCYILFNINNAITLKQKLIDKKQQNKSFSVAQLIEGINRIVNALTWLKYHNHPHQNITTDSIYIKDNNFILADPWISPLKEPPGQYPSPQKLMKICGDIEEEDPYASDIFSLGMVVLQCLFGVPKGIYKNNKVDKNKIIQYIKDCNNAELQQKLQIMLNGEPFLRKNILHFGKTNKNVNLKMLKVTCNQPNMVKQIIDDDIKANQSNNKQLYKVNSANNLLQLRPKAHTFHEYHRQPDFRRKPVLQQGTVQLPISQNTQKNKINNYSNIVGIGRNVSIHQANDHNSTLKTVFPNNFIHKKIGNGSDILTRFQLNQNIKGTQSEYVRGSETLINPPYKQISKGNFQLKTYNNTSTFTMNNQKNNFQKASSGYYQPANQSSFVSPQQLQDNKFYHLQIQQSIKRLQDQISKQFKPIFVKHNTNVVKQSKDISKISEESLQYLQSSNKKDQQLVSKQIPQFNRQNNQSFIVHQKVISSTNNEEPIQTLIPQTTVNSIIYGHTDQTQQEKTLFQPIKVVDKRQHQYYKTQENNEQRVSPQKQSPNKNQQQKVQQPTTPPIRHSSQLQIANNLTIPQESDEDSQNSQYKQIKGEYVEQYYENGGHYKGYVKNGKRFGEGTFFYKDGGYYEGHWKQNMMNGYGKLYYDTGRLAYEGYWYKDQFHGRGKVYNDTPTPLNESFNYINFENIELYWDYYEGDLVHDSKEGYGKIMLSNGESYEGQFKNDKVNGKGVFKKIGGQLVKGIWIESRLISQL